MYDISTRITESWPLQSDISKCESAPLLTAAARLHQAGEAVAVGCVNVRPRLEQCQLALLVIAMRREHRTG